MVWRFISIENQELHSIINNYKRFIFEIPNALHRLKILECKYMIYTLYNLKSLYTMYIYLV